ncbi:hypothetical protein NPIL_469801 [Nephila pilipes]|uniref:Uncharacterized protein n=1 Tax=Nephila pilipes TaxID=299642 RepID=A0A8X6NG17_NEPPI|nr:hypothetical protein NPIL_469801 [Nephila pilipes]
MCLVDFRILQHNSIGPTFDLRLNEVLRLMMLSFGVQNKCPLLGGELRKISTSVNLCASCSRFRPRRLQECVKAFDLPPKVTSGHRTWRLRHSRNLNT